MGTFNMKFLILTVAFMLVQLSQQAALGEMYEDGDVQSQEGTEFTVDDSGNSNPPPGGRPSGRNLEEGQEPQEDPSERNKEVQEEVEPQEDPSERNQEVQEEVEPQEDPSERNLNRKSNKNHHNHHWTSEIRMIKGSKQLYWNNLF